jgi:hypothetical protein
MADFNDALAEASAKPVRAVEDIRRMRGGCQSHLMRCSDGRYYVVKFPNNPQGRRVLANELLCTALAKLLSLPCAHGAVVFVSEDLVRYSDDLRIQRGMGSIPCESGLCFGSQFLVNPSGKPVYDFLPSNVLTQLSNLEDFCGMVVFDTWTSNADDRQVAFAPNVSGSYRAVMIDHGSCFGGQAWQLTNSPRGSLHLDTRVYEAVPGIDAFQPWLDRLGEITRDVLAAVATKIPSEWYDGDRTSLDELLHQLYRRKDTVREKIQFLGCAFPNLFPNWSPRARCA